MPEERATQASRESSPVRRRAWGGRLERFDVGWQWVEARLCAAVLLCEIASLTFWVLLKGLSADYVPGANASGLACRSTIAAVSLGIAAHLGSRGSRGSRGRGLTQQRLVTASAVVVGLASGRLWAHAGVLYASNALNWLQNASSLMLIGGLRGLVTRFTLWLALLGASLATSRGKHIHIDVILRRVPAKFRAPSAIAGQLAAAAVCGLGFVGFLDHIAIASYRAPAVEPCPSDASRSCDTSASEKAAAVLHGFSSDMFLLGRQLSLDTQSLPHILVGTPYDKWLTASEWNAWLSGADWTAHFDKTAVDALRMGASFPPSPPSFRMPQVAVPGTGEDARGLLVRELTFVFPFGLLVLAVKFLLRALLILAGRVPVDPDALYDEQDVSRTTPREAPEAEGAAARTEA